MALLSDARTHFPTGRSAQAAGNFGLTSGATADRYATGVQAGLDWGFTGGQFSGARQGLQERWDTEGHTSTPSQKQSRRGVLRDIFWPVDAGSKTFKIWVKHNGHSPTPLIRIRANPDVGLYADALTSSGTSTDWQQLSVTVTVLSTGALEVWREVRASQMGAYALWDDISVS